ncbi:MAG: VPLPA-CTERM sorting domain-containing protein [Pseudomonadota bacterium]
MSHILTASVVAIGLSMGAAQAAVIDFGTNFGIGLSEGDNVTTFDFGAGLTGSVSVVNGVGNGSSVGEARIIDTVNGASADPDLQGPFTNTADGNDIRAFGNALIVQERAGLASGNADDERRGGKITFSFDQAIDLISLIYLDGEEALTVTAPGLTDPLGGIAAGIGGDNLFTELVFAGPNNTGLTGFSVTLDGSGALGGFEAQLSAVPLPAALPMLLLGAGAFAAFGRRRSS